MKSLFSFIKGDPLFLGVIAVVIIAVFMLSIRSCEKQEDHDNANLVNQGAIVERDASKSEVINHVEQAKDAVDNPTSDDLNRVCTKYDRNC